MRLRTLRPYLIGLILTLFFVYLLLSIYSNYWFPVIVCIVSSAASISVSEMIENLLEIRRINKATKNILREIPDFSIIRNKMRDKKKEHMKKTFL